MKKLRVTQYFRYDFTCTQIDRVCTPGLLFLRGVIKKFAAFYRKFICKEIKTYATDSGQYYYFST